VCEGDELCVSKGCSVAIERENGVRPDCGGEPDRNRETPASGRERASFTSKREREREAVFKIASMVVCSTVERESYCVYA
jgi:hypothetical protein